MKIDVILKTVVAGAAALAIAGCGGGGGDGAPAPEPGSLKIEGVAAVGAALADATVTIKCATGEGSGSTDTAGSYAVTMTGAALPCIIQVSGTAGGAAITLHSVTSSGTASGPNTTAVANVTPISEMIVAQLTGALPSEAFAGFQAGNTTVTDTAVTAAVTAIVEALRTAGIDLGSIDPLKTTLVAANGSNTGNQFDQLLDTLGEQVSPEALPLLVNQIANASATGSSAGLGDAMVAVSGGSLPGCPQALSGKYRTLDFFGRAWVRQIDFKAMKFNRGDGQALFDITASEDTPCEFTVTGTNDSNQQVRFDVVIGPSGAGAYRSANLSTENAVPGYIFPAQAHSAAAMGGAWTFLQSGFVPDEGMVQWLAKLTINGDNTVKVCDFELATPSDCYEETTMAAAARNDGGIDITDSSAGASLWGYRAPNGTMTLFGSTNPTGLNDNLTEQTIIVAAKLSSLALPAVDSVTKFWDIGMSQPGNRSTRQVSAPAAETVTVKTVDSATGAVTRERASDGRVDTVNYDKPLPGIRTRNAGVWNGVPFAPVYQIPLPGLGMTVSVNQNEHPSGTYIYNLSVSRQ